MADPGVIEVYDRTTCPWEYIFAHWPRWLDANQASLYVKMRLEGYRFAPILG